MDVIFLAFENDDFSKKWRSEKEKKFLNDNKDITGTIDKIRNSKKPIFLRMCDLAYCFAQNDETRARVLFEKQKISDDKVKAYYTELHEAKKIRQEKWINELMESVAGSFRKAIKDTGAGNKDDSVIVAALPEFFWTDINDDNKHMRDITNYHKPLYSSVVNSTLKKDNPIVQLTKDYDNLIFFAGTAMNKEINKENRAEEKTKNTLFVYYDGKNETWEKNHFSGIDGFHRRDVFANRDYLIKNKMGQADNKDAVPEIEFKGKKFAFDICLDFYCEDDEIPGRHKPLSAKLLDNKPDKKPDVNVLIAGGMSIYINNKLTDYATSASSNYILRCDASPDDTGCYCEIGDKANNTRHNLTNVSLAGVDFHIGQANVII